MKNVIVLMLAFSWLSLSHLEASHEPFFNDNKKFEFSTKKKGPPFLKVTKENIETLLESPEPLIIKVFTRYCGPCRLLSFVMDDLNREYGHLYRFAALNAEKEMELIHIYEITKFPTVLLFKEGQEVGRIIGFVKKEKFVEELKIHFE